MSLGQLDCPVYQISEKRNLILGIWFRYLVQHQKFDNLVGPVGLSIDIKSSNFGYLILPVVMLLPPLSFVLQSPLIIF